MGVRVKVQGLGLEDYDLAVLVCVWDLGLRIQGLGFSVQGGGLRVVGVWVGGEGFKV
jgi:hypothetical protein